MRSYSFIFLICFKQMEYKFCINSVQLKQKIKMGFCYSNALSILSLYNTTTIYLCT